MLAEHKIEKERPRAAIAPTFPKPPVAEFDNEKTEPDSEPEAEHNPGPAKSASRHNNRRKRADVFQDDDLPFNPRSPSDSRWRKKSRKKNPRVVSREQGLVPVDRVTTETRKVLENYAIHYVMFSLDDNGFLKRLPSCPGTKSSFRPEYYELNPETDTNWKNTISPLFALFAEGILAIKDIQDAPLYRVAKYSVRDLQTEMGELVDKLRGTPKVQELLAKAQELYRITKN